MATEDHVASSVKLRRDLRLFQLCAVLLVALGITLGAVLLPSGDELLLIHVRNRDIDRAREVLARPEEQGVSTVSSVVAHGELFLLEGRVDEALADLEAFVDATPDDAAAWRRLARLYQHAQRLEDQVRALGEVYRLEPSADLARQLASFYRWTGNETEEAGRLHDLVRNGVAGVDEYLRSARLEAALGRGGRAVAVLEDLARRDGRSIGYPELELYVSLLVDQGKAASLGERLLLFPLVRQEPAVLEQLAGAMRGWGWLEQAPQLFAVPPGLDGAPAFLAGRARAATGTAAAPRVLRELVQRHTIQPLSEDPLAAALALALSVREYQSVTQLLQSPTSSPPPDLVALAIGHAVSHGARETAQALVARFGDDGLVQSPFLALDLAVDRGDHARAAAWISQIDAVVDESPEQVAAVAQFEARLGLHQRAFDRLTRLVASGRAPEWALSDVVAVATRLSREDDGLRLLVPEPGARVSPGRRRAWVGLAVTTGRAHLVTAWLTSGRIYDTDAPALRDAFYLLSDRKDLERAAAVARRLVAVSAAPDDALMLGHALMAIGRPVEALAAFEASGVATAEARAAYDSALLQAMAAEPRVAPRLRTVFAARLRDGGLPGTHQQMLVEGLWAAGERASLFEHVSRLARQDLDRWLSPLVESAAASDRRSEAARLIVGADGGLAKIQDDRREDRVRALMELGAPDDMVLPELRRLALEQAGSWVYAYDERLMRAGHVSERYVLWMSIGREPTVPAPERRAAAARLVELGVPSAAAAIFEALAATAGPDDADLQQLLFLWGPRPDGRQREWLVGRLLHAPVAEQPAWMTRVAAAGGGSRIVAALPEPPPGASPDWLRAWTEAHRAGDAPALRRALSLSLARADGNVDTLRHVARMALAENLSELAATAFRAVDARAPGDREAQRWLGTLAFYERRSDEARLRLTEYVNGGGEDPEPLFQLGELKHEAGRKDEARRLYGRALERLTDPSANSPNEALLANVLVRLGERDRAVAAFERILHATPNNHHVRADLASALLQWGDHDRVRAVLDAQPHEPGHGAAEDGGLRRLDLLRVQWLISKGKYPEAVVLLEDLQVRYPGDLDVRLARAGFDAGRGRLAEAEDQYRTARIASPERSDVAALVRDTERHRAPKASVQAEARTISEAWSAQSTRASIEGRLAPYAPVSVTAERLTVTAPEVLLANSQVGPFTATLVRVEAAATAPVAAGTTLTGTVFATRYGAGLGASFTRHDVRGAWTITAERGRPFWEFVESTADDGRKDRLGVERQWRFNADTAAWVAGDLNRYRLHSGAFARSTAFTLGFVRTIRQEFPTLTLQYGLDKEHVRDAALVTATDGRLFAPVPLLSREVHLFGVVTRFPVPRLWEVDGSVGYTVDRFGGRGSFVTVRATPTPSARVGLELWGERRLYSITTTQRALRSGARLTVRF